MDNISLLKEYIDFVIENDLKVFKDEFSLANDLYEEIIIDSLDNCKSYKIILDNIHLICNIINKYLSKDIKIIDFINADKIGLVKLVFKDNFEINRQNISYISRWVRTTLTKIIAFKD